jgi:hypothetical protein
MLRFSAGPLHVMSWLDRAAGRRNEQSDMRDEWEVRRTPSGTIDIDFYAARALRLRAQAPAELLQFIQNRIRTGFHWLRAWRKSSSNDADRKHVGCSMQEPAD